MLDYLTSNTFLNNGIELYKLKTHQENIQVIYLCFHVSLPLSIHNSCFRCSYGDALLAKYLNYVYIFFSYQYFILSYYLCNSSCAWIRYVIFKYTQPTQPTLFFLTFRFIRYSSMRFNRIIWASKLRFFTYFNSTCCSGLLLCDDCSQFSGNYLHQRKSLMPLLLTIGRKYNN